MCKVDVGGVLLDEVDVGGVLLDERWGD